MSVFDDHDTRIIDEVKMARTHAQVSVGIFNAENFNSSLSGTRASNRA